MFYIFCRRIKIPQSFGSSFLACWFSMLAASFQMPLSLPSSICDVSTFTSNQRDMTTKPINNCGGECITNALCKSTTSTKPINTHNKLLVCANSAKCTLQLLLLTYTIKIQCHLHRFFALLLHFSMQFC